MKKLVHPNLVQLVEVIDAPLDRSLYMVMEYVERGAVMRCVEPGRGRYECPATGEGVSEKNCKEKSVQAPRRSDCKNIPPPALDSVFQSTMIRLHRARGANII